jgi:class 3 adenylate cyclase/putative methionine-R-sulfoxide reductase with GAF domain
VGDSPQAFPLADPGRLAAYQGDGHSAGRSSDDYTLDTLPEEMADGDPQMAECLWRSTLSRGPSRHGRCRRDPLRCFALSMRVEAMKRRSRASGKPAKARPRKALTVKGRNAPKAVFRLGPASAGRTEIARLSHELNEALQQQTATADVLKVISRSTFELQTVLNTLTESAARLCEAEMAVVNRLSGTVYSTAASFGISAKQRDWIATFKIEAGRSTITGRAAQEHKVVYIPDVQTEPEFTQQEWYEKIGSRSMLGIPLLREGTPIGVMVLMRRVVRPFSEKQIELAITFAAQAVIAIENTRLLSELRDSLQEQTATSEVLQVISSSPGDLEPVFAAMLENAVRICDAKFGNLWLREGNKFRIVAVHGGSSEYREYLFAEPLFVPDPQDAINRVVSDRDVVQIDDISKAPSHSMRMRIATIKIAKARTLVWVPMLKENEVVGIIAIYRQEVHSFSDKQIALVQNFAAQAVIAIENARLLNELRQRTADLSESLEQQIATSEVLQVISSSPGDLQPVFAAMLEKAVRICDATFGNVRTWDGKTFRVVATYKTPPALVEALKDSAYSPSSPHLPFSRMLASKMVVHIADLASEQAYTEQRIPTTVAAVELGGVRTVLLVPMLKDSEVVGAFILSRQEVRGFTEKQIALVTNFAAQAVIAIENARLLKELHERTEEVETLNQQLEQRVADQIDEIERMGRLRRFLPPQVADLIVASGTEKQLESHRREIAALFCDLRGFTGFSESADPEDVMALLREYHAAIGEIIIKYSGTLERYAGDGVMVVFNDPVPVENPALQAALMALEMRGAIGALTEKWRQLGHEIGFGIGIAHGYATLGTIGFEGRFDYAAIGTVSNVASRLCDEAKPGQILISPRVLMAVKDAVTVEAVGEFELKGIRRPIAAYNVLAVSAPTH